MLRVDVDSNLGRHPGSAPLTVPTPRYRPAVRHRLAAITSLAAELEPLAAMTRPEYATSPVARRAVERLVQLTVDAVAGVADLVVKSAERDPGAVESDALAQFQALGVIPRQLRDHLVQATDWRDQLVHPCQRIDDECVLAASGDLVRWARQYVHATEAWISRHEEPEN